MTRALSALLLWCVATCLALAVLPPFDALRCAVSAIGLVSSALSLGICRAELRAGGDP